MKYTIELTDKQKDQMDCIINIARRYVGFNPELEPVEYSSESQLEEHREQDYDKGLEDGYKGYKYIKKWFVENFIMGDEDNLFPEYKRRQADTCCLEDIITDVGFSETLKRVKAYEEKKVEEEIKVGDEVITNADDLAIVLRIDSDHFDVFYDNGLIDEPKKINCKKTGRHFDEVEQLLSKLKGV